MRAILVLEDGKSFNANSDLSAECFGEVILNTAVVGYQEMITDPTNAGKILVLTYPLIGNYGVAPKFNESNKIWVSGLVVKEKSRIYSNFQAKSSLSDFLKEKNALAIYNLDTRTLAVHLREKGPLFGIISTKEFDSRKLADKISQIKRQPAQTFLPEISVSKLKIIGKGKKLAVLDLGVTSGLLRQLEALGFSLNILPYNSNAKQILSIKPKGLIISSGPENDIGLARVAQNIKPLIGKLPMLGVVTGCQVLAVALGAGLSRLKLGHRGANYPLTRPGSFKGEITIQNHGYVIDHDALRKVKRLKVTACNLNDHTLEEIESKKLKLIGVQYNPVSAGFDQVNPILIKFNKLLGR
ncbi:MAG: carbamoyl phosphate synthase small subunit [Candidatus Omnitrophica bacterium]|nr:carbamoyl phosphate synthase small subunit [Candidatus Omnitrophota bacterium]MBU1923387.1 carbamoyl phosphate synthase small subunit [Candidatus Omnitrophota bacterium]